MKSILGGIVARNCKLQVFFTPKLYGDLIEEARGINLKFRTDSELITKVVNKFLYDLPIVLVHNEKLKEALKQRDSVIQELRDEIGKKKEKVKK